jgi:hypothetical protein
LSDYARGFEEGRRAGIEDAAKAVEAMKNGYTVEMEHGALVPDEDGPWFLKGHYILAIRSLATPAPVAPPGGHVVKCPVCTRVGEFRVAEGNVIGNCAQCWLGEGRKVPLVIVSPIPAPSEKPTCAWCGRELLRGPIGGGHFDWLECACSNPKEQPDNVARLKRQAAEEQTGSEPEGPALSDAQLDKGKS